MAEQFEEIVKKCKVSGDYMPAWELFVNTKFYVGIHRLDSGDVMRDFRFLIFDSPNDGSPCLIVSEVLERLSKEKSKDWLCMTGSELIRKSRPGLSILVALSDAGFGVPSNVIEWLRKSMQPV